MIWIEGPAGAVPAPYETKGETIGSETVCHESVSTISSAHVGTKTKEKETKQQPSIVRFLSSS